MDAYKSLLGEIEHTIKSGRHTAIRRMNRSLIEVYWQIGQHILDSQAKHGWGKNIVEKLASDLQGLFPKQTGFSSRNLWNMRRFYEIYCEFPNLKQLVAEIPWGHHITIMQKVTSMEAREYYIQASRDMKWSRKVLLNQIKGSAYERHLVAPKQNNFQKVLPEHIAEQARDVMKSNYLLDFIGLKEPLVERDLEQRLLDHIQKFLLELGYGFSFMGSQYVLTLGDKTYRIDLLFFHRRLNCLVAIELKMGAFKPEFAGKMNFYLEVLDEKVKLPRENPSIGIILCAEKNALEVEYALRTTSKPMGVAEYEFRKTLPQELAGSLPSPEELKNQIKK